jgi:hypothetical protein
MADDRESGTNRARPAGGNVVNSGRELSRSCLRGFGGGMVMHTSNMTLRAVHTEGKMRLAQPPPLVVRSILCAKVSAGEVDVPASSCISVAMPVAVCTFGG